MAARDSSADKPARDSSADVSASSAATTPSTPISGSGVSSGSLSANAAGATTPLGSNTPPPSSSITAAASAASGLFRRLVSSVGHILSQPIDQVGRATPYYPHSAPHYNYHLVGDAKVGKSSLLTACFRQSQPSQPTVASQSSAAVGSGNNIGGLLGAASSGVGAGAGAGAGGSSSPTTNPASTAASAAAAASAQKYICALPSDCVASIVAHSPQTAMLVECPQYHCSAYFAEKTDGSPLDDNPALVLVCFSLIDRGSLLNAKDKWLPYIFQYEVPRQCLALVGLKADLRDEMLAQQPKPSKLKKDSSNNNASGDGSAAVLAAGSSSSSSSQLGSHMPLLQEPSMHATFRIGNLSTELLLQIFSQLSTKDLAAASAVCKRWHKVANTPVLWRDRTRGAPIRPEEIKKVLRDAEIQHYFEISTKDKKGLRNFYSKVLQRGKKSIKYYGDGKRQQQQGGMRGPVTPEEPTSAL